MLSSVATGWSIKLTIQEASSNLRSNPRDLLISVLPFSKMYRCHYLLVPVVVVFPNVSFSGSSMSEELIVANDFSVTLVHRQASCHGQQGLTCITDIVNNKYDSTPGCYLKFPFDPLFKLYIHMNIALNSYQLHIFVCMTRDTHRCELHGCDNDWSRSVKQRSSA